MISPARRTSDGGGESGKPVSADLLRYLVAVFLIGSVVALVENNNKTAAWILTITLILGIMVSQPLVGIRLMQLANRINP